MRSVFVFRLDRLTTEESPKYPLVRKLDEPRHGDIQNSPADTRIETSRSALIFAKLVSCNEIGKDLGSYWRKELNTFPYFVYFCQTN